VSLYAFVSIVGVGAVFALALLANARFIPIRIAGVAREADDSSAALVDRVYDPNFVFADPPALEAGIYLPKYDLTAPEEAERLASRFGIDAAATETDDRYFFVSETGRLAVDKYGGGVAFASEGGETPGEWDPTALAIETLQGYGISTECISAAERAAGGRRIVELFAGLEGRADMSAPRRLTFDAEGRLLELRCSFARYERIATARIMTTRAAYALLPTDSPDKDGRIDLKRCELVFIAADSVIQPAYLFTGATPGGANFSYFVKAAVYD
jgi:hypothetical protein